MDVFWRELFGLEKSGDDVTSPDDTDGKTNNSNNSAISATTARDHPWKLAKSNAAQRYSLNMECLREVFCLPSAFLRNGEDQHPLWTAEELWDQLRK